MKSKEITRKSASEEIAGRINLIAKEARKEALNEVLDMLRKREEITSNVLRNGIAVTWTAPGERFIKIYNKRVVVLSHRYMLKLLICEICDLIEKD